MNLYRSEFEVRSTFIRARCITTPQSALVPEPMYAWKSEMRTKDENAPNTTPQHENRAHMSAVRGNRGQRILEVDEVDKRGDCKYFLSIHVDGTQRGVLSVEQQTFESVGLRLTHGRAECLVSVQTINENGCH